MHTSRIFPQEPTVGPSGTNVELQGTPPPRYSYGPEDLANTETNLPDTSQQPNNGVSREEPFVYKRKRKKREWDRYEWNHPSYSGGEPGGTHGVTLCQTRHPDRTFAKSRATMRKHMALPSVKRYVIYTVARKGRGVIVVIVPSRRL